MNILILASKPPYPSKDGSSLATLCLAKGLAHQGHKITILAISTPKHPCRIDQIPDDLMQLMDFHLVEIDTRTNPLKAFLNLIFSKLPYNIERFIASNYSLKLKELIRLNSFDIIQLEGIYLTPYINIIKELTISPIVYRAHNIEHEIWHRLTINETNWFKLKYFSLLSNRLLKIEVDLKHQVDALVAITKRDEHWFLSHGFEKPSISLPMGYSTDQLSANRNTSINEPCFLGSLDWKPNQEGIAWFIDHVWPLIMKELPNLNLHVAGRNAPASILSKISKEKNIIFHGEVENSQSYLLKYPILVVPILSGSGMRVKIVEGMMLGSIVVTTTIGIEGIDAINHEHAIIVDAPTDFAREIIELIRKPNYRESIVEKACIFARQNFDESIQAKRLDSFYKQLV